MASAEQVSEPERAAWGPPAGHLPLPTVAVSGAAPLPGGIASAVTGQRLSGAAPLPGGIASAVTDQRLSGAAPLAGGLTSAVTGQRAAHSLANKRRTKGPRANRGRRSSTGAVSIFEAMDAKANKHRCAPLYNVWVYAFNPSGRFRAVWDTIILALVVVSCFRDPYHTAFHLERQLWEQPASTGMDYIDVIIDVIFYVDMALNFWTGYDTGYMIVTNKGLIAKHYLATRFPVDLLATVEWDLLIRWIVCDLECTGDMRDLNDLTAVAKMLKVLRLARAGPLISRLTAHMTAHSAYINALKFFLYVVVVAHVLACLFYMIPIIFTCEILTSSPLDDGPELFNTNHTCMATSWRVNYGLNDVNNNVDEHGYKFDGAMSPVSQYTSALYWSLTTMTTIGYGDRGPGNDPEIAFTMCSELIGLFFFVLLLDQITTVYNELRHELSIKNAIKDEVVQFMKSAIPPGSDGEEAKAQLIQKAVTFLNFKSNSKSSHRVDKSGAFSHLSDELQEQITIAVFQPMLATIRMFGHSFDDHADTKIVRKLFAEADPDGSGELDEGEVRKLISNLGVELTDADLQEAIDAMDSSRAKEKRKESDVHVELEEFQQWWYLQKHHRPKVAPCPNGMLMWFALRIQSECSSPGDRIVRKGDYGLDRFFVVLQGTAEVRDHADAALPGEDDGSWTKGEVVPRLLRQIVADKESDPLFGLLGVLNDDVCATEYTTIKRATQKVAVYAGRHEHDYTECLFFSHKDLKEVLSAYGAQWDINPDFDSPLRFWQECARNYYAKLFSNDPQGYFWGRYLQDRTLQRLANRFKDETVPDSPRLVPLHQPPGVAGVHHVEQRLTALEASIDKRLGRMEELLSKLVTRQ
jgi:Ca2+-binding EF-hand superfamily protein